MKFLKPLSLLLFFVACLVILTSVVSAENTSNTTTSNSNIKSVKKIAPGLVKKMSTTETGGMTASKAGSRKALLKIRLDQAKLRVCQVKEKIITNRSNNMVNHVNRLITVFDSIVTRIQNYYLTRLVPQGKTLANYDALILDIQTNKNVLTPLLETIQADVTNFKCDGDDPKGQLDQFKEDMHAVIAGLKAYKTSIRNLIVAIASIKGVGDGNATGSATQLSITPTAVPTAVPTLSQ